MYEKIVAEMMTKMTLEDKLAVLTPIDNHYGCVPSLDFKGPVPQDVPRGGADNWLAGKPTYGDDGKPNDGQYHPVAYPSNSAVAMSWDKELAYHVGSQFALEAKANPATVNILNRPALNLKRSPLCGRNYDYLSEDPIHTALIASAYAKGIQSKGIIACPKHFIANNQEYDRMNTNSLIDERTMQEVYLRTWKILLQDARPGMVMSSYNRVNGSWVNSSKPLMDALRKEIGFDGIVVSDFLALHHDKVTAHKCGMEIELADAAVHIHELREAVSTGEITEDELDKLVSRVLEFSLCALAASSPEKADMEALHDDAVTVAEQCAVLMKNSGILPLEKGDCRRIVIAGQLAAEPNVEGSGSGYMNGYRVDNPLSEIQSMHENTLYCQGYQTDDTRPPVDPAPNGELLDQLRDEVLPSDTVIAFVGSPIGYESESYDRPHTHLQKNQQAMLDLLTELSKNVILIVTGGSVYDLTPWNDNLQAIVYAGLAGEGYGKAIARILFGDAEPGGRLTETFPLHEEHGPSFFNFTPPFREMASVNYGEGLLIGYRWYDTRKLPVLYPFGHGLSYTSFAYSDFFMDKASMTANEECHVRLTVTNTGNRRGSQVIQLYIHEREGRYLRPQKELRDFVKLNLEPGESKTATFTISRKDLEIYSDVLHKWGVQTDDYEILLNISSTETVASGWLSVTDGDSMHAYTEMTPLVQFVSCEAFHEYLRQNKPEWMQNFFDLGKTDFLVLMLPLPFFRLSQPVQGPPMFTLAEIQEIIDYCNEHR